MIAKKTRSIIGTIVGIILTFLILFPFLLVILNTAKTSADIVISPIAFPKNWGQMLINMNNVINNVNFSYWTSFTSSMIITLVSLVLITLFSCMAAWVLSRNHRKAWSNTIFMILVAAMVIPFQVVMLPILTVYKNIAAFTGIKMLSSYKGIIFAYIGFGGSMSVFIFHGFIKGIAVLREHFLE